MFFQKHCKVSRCWIRITPPKSFGVRSASGAKRFDCLVFLSVHFPIEDWLKVRLVLGGLIATVQLAWLCSGSVLWLDSRDYRHASKGEQTTGINYANEMVVRHGADLMQPIHYSFTKMQKRGGYVYCFIRVYKGYDASRVPGSLAHTSWLQQDQDRRVPFTQRPNTFTRLCLPEGQASLLPSTTPRSPPTE